MATRLYHAERPATRGQAGPHVPTPWAETGVKRRGWGSELSLSRRRCSTNALTPTIAIDRQPAASTILADPPRLVDNITHTLIGYALARAMPQSVRASRSRLRSPPCGRTDRRKEAAVVWTSIVASNFPDLDFVMGFVASDRQLAYLLHHRGHTHTLAFVPIAALISAALGAWILRPHAERRDLRHLFWVGAAAGLLHVVFDSFNNYGVHPFYPLDNHWYYGDFLFIVEPLFFFCLVPLIVLRARSIWGRLLGAACGVVVLALLWMLPPQPEGAAVFGMVWLLAVSLWQWRVPGTESARVAVPALVSLAAAIGLYAATGQLARRDLAELRAERFASERPVDLVLTPVPGNPLCWTALSASIAADGQFVVRRGAMSLAPGLMDARACRFFGPSTTAPLQTIDGASSVPVFDAEFRAPLAELRRLEATSCRARAALGFMRTPYWVDRPRMGRVLGDLRYDRDEELDFADVLLDEGQCLDWVPPWVPPRADVLGMRGPT